MNRKEFLKISGLASVGMPFFLNGITTITSNRVPSLPFSCENILDRVLIVIRLAGANDGLNTVVPIEQYDTYANLRPTIKLELSGTNGIIPLDNTVETSKQVGLHPKLNNFKMLYDEGKLKLVQGVGYPLPNRSHFAGENIMFAGKDGNSSQDLTSGILGNYLVSLFPGLAGTPNPLKSDPLAIHLGSPNPSLFYEHGEESGVEYNINPIFDDLTDDLAGRLTSLPENSEYYDLLDLICEIEANSDKYYDRIIETFNNGINSSTLYPDSGLAKQLKTVARLIQGGSKTKVFQVTLFGFDTHVNQVTDGDTQNGLHAMLLQNLDSSIAAFQKDIEMLGIDSNILTVTFSEFGRQVKENGSKGTDHGDLSPFFVIGSSVNPGILGDHPIFTDTESFYYAPEQLKFDYRQLYGTILQDWLGANQVVMGDTGINEFIQGNLKLDVINSLNNAFTNNCLVGPQENPYCSETINCVPLTEQDGWIYYGEEGSGEYLLGVESNPAGDNANTEALNLTIIFEILCSEFVEINFYAKKNINTGEGMFIPGYYWNILSSDFPDGWVNLRFFKYTENQNVALQEAESFKINNNANHLSPIIYFQASSPLKLPDDLRDDGLGFNYPVNGLDINSQGSIDNQSFIQFNQIQNIANSGGGSFSKVSNIGSGKFATKGTMRFNNKLKKFEGFSGQQWKKLH